MAFQLREIYFLENMLQRINLFGLFYDNERKVVVNESLYEYY